MRPFHLAFPVQDLEAARGFYTGFDDFVKQEFVGRGTLFSGQIA